MDEIPKFFTCKHRTEKESIKALPACCGREADLMKGYTCLKRNIFPLDDEECKTCEKYESKN